MHKPVYEPLLLSKLFNDRHEGKGRGVFGIAGSLTFGAWRKNETKRRLQYKLESHYTVKETCNDAYASRSENIILCITLAQAISANNKDEVDKADERRRLCRVYHKGGGEYSILKSVPLKRISKLDNLSVCSTQLCSILDRVLTSLLDLIQHDTLRIRCGNVKFTWIFEDFGAKDDFLSRISGVYIKVRRK